MASVAPPAVPRSTLLRRLPRMVRHPIPVFTDYLDRYGDNLIIHIGGARRTLLTRDAGVARHVLRSGHRNYEKSEVQTAQLGKYLGRGLLTNTGEDWLRQRRLIQPGFHRRRIAALESSMQAVVGEECARAAAMDGIDLFSFTRRVAFRIIARALFTDGVGKAETRRLHEILDALQAFVIYPIRLPVLRGPLRWTGIEGRHLALAEEARGIVRRQVAKRQGTRARAPKDDLLEMLLDSRYEDSGEPMSEERLIDEIMILFAAGYETSANALAWTLWLLLRHPTELRRLQDEPDDGYLTQVIEESMRLYPPAWITDRVAHTDDAVDEVRIEAGVMIAVFIYGIHRSARYYEAPDEFQPARMHPDRKRERPAMSFLPFGGGPRQCIGNHFAMLEMQLFLRHLLARYRLTGVGPLPELTPRPYVTLHQDRRVTIAVDRA